MAGFISKIARGSLVLVLVLPSLAGLVCADGPNEQQAMECCRRDAHHCNMPEKTEDCCKPDRSSKNPASVEAPSRFGFNGRGAAHVAVIPAVVTIPDVVYRVAPFSSSRGSPYELAKRPLDIPLLN